LRQRQEALEPLFGGPNGGGLCTFAHLGACCPPPSLTLPSSGALTASKLRLNEALGFAVGQSVHQASLPNWDTSLGRFRRRIGVAFKPVAVEAGLRGYGVEKR